MRPRGSFYQFSAGGCPRPQGRPSRPQPCREAAHRVWRQVRTARYGVHGPTCSRSAPLHNQVLGSAAQRPDSRNHLLLCHALPIFRSRPAPSLTADTLAAHTTPHPPPPRHTAGLSTPAPATTLQKKSSWSLYSLRLSLCVTRAETTLISTHLAWLVVPGLLSRRP